MDKIKEVLSTIIADYKFGNIDMEEAIKEILQSLQSSRDDKLISELQERAEIAEDELDKIKQSDKISDEEIEATAADIVFYNEEKRNWWIEGAKFIRDKLSVSEYSSAGDNFIEFLQREKELGISDKKTIERIEWYWGTYFKEDKKQQ